MTLGFGTASLVELIWTAVAALGLIFWAWNGVTAGRALAAVRGMGVASGDPRELWARFSVLLTGVFAVIEAQFLVAGALAILRPESAGEVTVGRLLTRWLLVTGGVLIAYVAWRWRAVDAQLLEMARTYRRQPGRTPEGEDQK